MSFDKRPSLNASAYTKQHNFKVTAKSACQLMEFFCSSFRDRLLTMSEGAGKRMGEGGGGRVIRFLKA